MPKCNVKAIIEIKGIMTEEFDGMAKDEADDEKLQRIKEDFIQKLLGNPLYIPSILIICSVKEEG